MILIFTLILGLLAACGGNGSKSSGDSSSGAANSSAGASAGGESSEPVTFRVLAENQWVQQYTEAVRPELEKKGIKLETEFYDYTTFNNKLKLALASGGGDYDMVFLYTEHIKLWAESQSLIPLDDFMKKYNYDESDFPESAKTYAKVNGQWFAAPMDAVSQVFFYRTDIYEEAGLEPPKTIEEMYEQAKLLTKDNQYGIVFPAGPGEGASSFWSYFFWSYGGEYLDANGNPTVNTPEALESANMFAELAKFAPPGVKTWGNAEAVAAFNSGNVAAMIAWPGFFTDINDPNKSQVAGKVGVTALPPGPSGKAIPRFGMNAIGITANAENLDAAYEVLYEFTKPEMGPVLAQYSIPVRKSVSSSPELRAQYPTLGPSADGAQFAKERPISAEADRVISEIGNAINSIVAGKDAQSELAELQLVLEDLLK
jgi:multiple sugar transport system substrate-binding protein